MNLELLNLLKNSDDYISGEEISKKFNVSRSAIWKQINTLKNAGYIIDGISKKGYKLISCPDLIIKEEIINNLNTKIIGKHINYYSEIDSTNNIAKKLASESIDGTTIIAEIQNAGKGRLGRIWTSPKGGIWTSIILKPNIEPINANKVTQVAAAALINVLKSLNIESKIKWPNDIYINNKKFAGILTEMKCDMDRVHYLVVGVGMNINIPLENLPEEIRSIATSLMIETGETFNRNHILIKFYNEFEKLYLALVNNNDFSTSLNICRDNSIILNKDAYLITHNNKEKVHCIGIDDNGMLIIKDSLGNTKTVLSGEITFHME